MAQAIIQISVSQGSLCAFFCPVMFGWFKGLWKWIAPLGKERALRPLISRALKSTKMKSPNKVKDQICNMGNGLSCVHPRHRIVCATTSPSHAGCSGDSFSHLCDSSPVVSRFSAHTCCHTHIGSEMHIGIGAYTHTIWNGGWRRGAGVDNWKTHGGEYQHTNGAHNDTGVVCAGGKHVSTRSRGNAHQ